MLSILLLMTPLSLSQSNFLQIKGSFNIFHGSFNIFHGVWTHWSFALHFYIFSLYWVKFSLPVFICIEVTNHILFLYFSFE